jgi:hypothetical protein
VTRSSTATREPSRDILAVTAAHACTVPDRAPLARAAAGRVAIDRGADPVLAEQLLADDGSSRRHGVIWSPETLMVAGFRRL